MGKQFTYTNRHGVTYYLNCKTAILRAGMKVPIYFFSREAGSPDATELPKDRYVHENPRNGFLTIRKKEDS